MSSKSSSRRSAEPLAFGTITGFRGRDGEMTVRVASGRAERWIGLKRLLVARRGSGDQVVRYGVEHARAYRDRLVLKLRGVDDPGAVEALRGAVVLAPPEEVPDLPPGVHYVARLVGLAVVDHAGNALGRVEDVVEAAGRHLLVVARADGGELLVPFADGIVEEVSESGGWIRVRPPDGLLELNRDERGRK